MTLLSDRPTRHEFINTSGVESTAKGYRSVFASFDHWLKSMDATEEQFLHEMRGADVNTRARTVKSIQDYWMNVPREGWQVKGISTIRQYRSILLKWFEENDVIISQNKLKRLANLPKSLVEMRFTPDTKFVNDLIGTMADIDKKAFFCLLSCTAMRHGELRATKLKDFDISERMIRIPAERTKTRTERLTFFTPEARHYLKRHLKENNIVDPDSLVFSLCAVSYHWALRRGCRVMKMDEKFTNGRNKMNIHRLRAFANQCITSAVDARFADVIKGHIGGLRTYDVGNIHKMKKDYDKAIPELTLDKTRLYEEMKENEGAKGRGEEIIMREIDHLKEEMERLRNSESY